MTQANRTKYTWEENVERIMQQTNYFNPLFKKFLEDLEPQGGPFFTAPVYKKLFLIKEAVTKRNDDYLTIVTGIEGSGKSTLAMQMAATVDPNFSEERILYTAEDLNEFIHEIEKNPIPGRAVILDEGNMFLFSRDSMSGKNKMVVRWLSICRQKNVMVFVCVPNFFTIDTYIREHRVKAIFNCYERGKFKAYAKAAVPQLNRWGRNLKDINKVKLTPDLFFYGSWNKAIPKINGLTEDSYKSVKNQHYLEFIEEFDTFVKAESKDSKFMKASDVARELGLARQTVMKRIRSGDIPAKQIGRRWYVLKDELTNFTNKS